MYYIMQ